MAEIRYRQYEFFNVIQDRVVALVRAG